MPSNGREGRIDGAGAVLTSMDGDGTQAGYDIALTRTISDAVGVPVIASGGAEPEHFVEALTDGGGCRSCRQPVPFSAIEHHGSQSASALPVFRCASRPPICCGSAATLWRTSWPQSLHTS